MGYPNYSRNENNVNGGKEKWGCGLSTPHNWAKEENKLPAGIHYHNASVIFWDGASRMKVSRAGYKLPQCGGGRRGAIKEYSHGSKRRLMQTFAELRRDAIYYFCTLTYPNIYPDNPKVYKEHLHRFERELKRKYEKQGGIWVQEFQERGAVHFAFLWDVTYIVEPIERIREFVAQKWYEIVDSGDIKHLSAGTQVQLVRNFRKATMYMAKEMSKASQKEQLNVGRYWGVFGREFIHFADQIVAVISDSQACNVIRYFRKFAHMKYTRAWRSLSIFGDATQWLSKCEMLLYPDNPKEHPKGKSRSAVFA